MTEARNSGPIGPDGKPFRKGPVAVVVVGMAGTGKSTLVQRLNLDTEESGVKALYVNLDPACIDVNYGASIDIRDTVDYAEVQKQYSLGPNGAIMTSLNLFATKINDFIEVLETVAGDPPSAPMDAIVEDVHVDLSDPSAEPVERSGNCRADTDLLDEVPKYLVMDTPGQIEVFTWSASGGVVLSSLAAAFPTVIVYVIDAARCAAGPEAFGANILYAASIAARTGLPFVLAVNKADAADASTVVEWLRDPLAFSRHVNSLPSHDSSYAHSYAQSMSLFVGSFLEVVPAVPLSALTGDGIRDLWAAVDGAAATFLAEVVPRMAADAATKRAEEAARVQRTVDAVAKDTEDEARGARGVGAPAGIPSVSGARGRIVSREVSRAGQQTRLGDEMSKAAQPGRYRFEDEEEEDYSDVEGRNALLAQRNAVMDAQGKAGGRMHDGLNILRFGGLAPAARDADTYSGSEGEPSTESDNDEVEAAAAEVRHTEAAWVYELCVSFLIILLYAHQRLYDLLTALRTGNAHNAEERLS